MPPLDPNDPDNLVKLTQNDDPPDGPPTDIPDPAQDDHQQGDTGIQQEEVIDAGYSAALGVTDPLGPRKKEKINPHPDEEGFDKEPNEDEV